MTDKLTSRKFVLAVLVVLCATGLCAFAKIGGVEYAGIVGGVVAAYLAANVTAKVVT